MASTSLALPIDIPWERICVSEDMMDKAACDTDRPAKWQSSIAVFKYVPEDDYQVYAGRKITYLKVVCTISGYQPKLEDIYGVLDNWGGITGTEMTQAELERRLATYRPCNEAVVQVTVSPPPGKGNEIPLSEYPYIMDFQPKKRELYEMATDTKEFMSRSLDSLNIRKSAGTSGSQEVLDIDQGFNFGTNFQYQGTGGGVQYGQPGQWGTKSTGSGESGLARTTDESRERRETVSHSTQLTQLYHLLDSYHQGTNRIVFLIQPRPHVIKGPDGLISGVPRPIEGIQEFFMIVNQPKDQEDYCLDVRLDTGHYYEKQIMDYDYLTDTTEFSYDNPSPVKEDNDKLADGDVLGDLFRDSKTWWFPVVGTVTLWDYNARVKYHCYKRTRQSSTTYKSPKPDFQIDVNNFQKNPDNINGFHVLAENKVGDATCTINTTPDGEALTINIEVTSRACIKGNIAEMDTHLNVDPLALASAASLDPTGGLAIASAALTAGTFEAGKNLLAYNGAPNIINTQYSSAQTQVQVFLKSRAMTKDTGLKVKTFFITTRGLCCCKGSKIKPEGIVYKVDLKQKMAAAPLQMTAVAPIETVTTPRQPPPPGENRITLDEANALHAEMRDEMLRSLVSPKRTEPRTISETDMLTDLVLPVLLQDPFSRYLLAQSSADALPQELAGRLCESLGVDIKQISRYELLTTSAAFLREATGLDELAINRLKAAMIEKPFKASPIYRQPKPVQQPEEKTNQQATLKQRGSTKRSSRKPGK